MATLARRLRQRLAVTSMFMLSGLVGTLCGSGCGAPALASDTIPIPFPPQVTFISNGKYKGTLQTQGMTLPITGTLEYLSGNSQLTHVSVDTGGQQITSDSWVTSTPTVINEWEIVSTDPTTCRKEVLSGGSYPQCTAWNRTPSGTYSLECTVTVQGNKATLDILAMLSPDNKLVQLQENTTIGENDNSQDNESSITNSITIIMTEQGNTPPTPSDFELPSICNAPNGNNQGENDNSQGNEVGRCTGTIPSICL
jgi:hypothetical protein